MQCPSCGAENPDAHRFCDVCGEPLAQCAECGAMGRSGARFCGQCGAHLTVAETSESPQHGRTDHGTAQFSDAAAAAARGDEAEDYAARAEQCAGDAQWSQAMEYAARAGAAAAE